MSIMIIHASIEGQTARIARYVRDLLEEEGPQVQMVDTERDPSKASFSGVDQVVLAAPVHERRYPAGFEAFVAARLSDFEAPQTVMLAVSLAAAFPEKMDDARDFQMEFEMRTGFTPDEVHYVAGALRPSSYGYFENQILRHVVLQGAEIDPTTKREFTDWEAIRKTTLKLIRP